MKQDIYAESLNRILNELESIYGIKTVDKNNNLLRNLNIIDCMVNLKELIKEVSGEKKDKIQKKTLKSVIHLGYISLRMKYYKKIRLDFSKYPNMGEVASILLLFTSKVKNSNDIKRLNSIVVVLAQIDKKTAKARYAMGYRFLRIFIVMALYGHMVHASIVADFILNQFITK